MWLYKRHVLQRLCITHKILVIKIFTREQAAVEWEKSEGQKKKKRERFQTMQTSPLVTESGESEHEKHREAEKAMTVYCLLDGQSIIASLAGHLRVVPLATTAESVHQVSSVRSFVFSVAAVS